MFNKTYKEIEDFTVAVESIENLDKLLNYIKSDFYSSIKLLISVSSTFSIFWKVILPFIVSFGLLISLSSIKVISELINSILGVNYILGILFCLIALTVIYILNTRKYFINCIEKSKKLIEENK